MIKYKVLVLTDHHTHGEGESIYELLKEMLGHQYCHDICISTRGDLRNEEFFSNYKSSVIYAKKIDHNFQYHNEGAWFDDPKKVDVTDFDVLFLRLDRPLSDAQLNIVEFTFNEKLIINNPKGIINTGSKRFLLEFPDICPDMNICHTIEDVYKNLDKFSIVLKPLHGYGGAGLIKIDNKKVFFEEIEYDYIEGLGVIEKLLLSNGAMLSMRYLSKVTNGDKRVVVVGGNVLGATLRLPANGSWLCNLKQGGKASYAEADQAEYEIAEVISPILRKHGVLIFGFDTLENDNGVRCLSEINTLNVGGFLQAQEFSQKPVIKNASQLIWEYIAEKA